MKKQLSVKKRIEMIKKVYGVGEVEARQIYDIETGKSDGDVVAIKESKVKLPSLRSRRKK